MEIDIYLGSYDLLSRSWVVMYFRGVVEYGRRYWDLTYLGLCDRMGVQPLYELFVDRYG